MQGYPNGVWVMVSPQLRPFNQRVKTGGQKVFLAKLGKPISLGSPESLGRGKLTKLWKDIG